MSPTRLEIPPLTVVLPEWGSDTITGTALTDHDRQLAERLRSQGHLILDELRTGVRIQSRAWVGTVRFETMEVRVTPKLAGDALGLAQMLMFTRGLDALKRSHGAQALDPSQRPDLLELLALLLVEVVERIVQEGLSAGYVEREDDLAAVRGRLLADRQLLQHFGRVDRVSCRFDELEYDTTENRLLAAALRVCARRVRREWLHRRLRYLSAVLEEVCDPERIDLHAARTALVYDRQNAHYKDAHMLSWLVLDGAGVDDLLSERGSLRSFAFLLDMNGLFEDFVWRLIERLFPTPSYHVESQKRTWSVLWNPTTHQSYRSIRPDVIIRRRGQRGAVVAVDAKYKRYDMIDPASTDIYQGLLYAQAYNDSREPSTPGIITPTAILIYPTSRPESRTERVQLRRPSSERAAELILLGLPVRQTLETLEQPTASPAAILEELISGLLGVSR